MTQTRQSLTHRTVAGMLWMSYGNAAFHVLQLVVLAVLARLLTPDEFGVVNAALIVTGLLALVSQIGVGPALVQRPELERRHLDAGFTIDYRRGGLIGILVLPASAATYLVGA